MGFTSSQQGQFRPLVDEAWIAHCRRESLDPKDKVSKRSWYETELMACVGATSTKPLDRTRDFDCAMAHFEYLADNGSTYWQSRAETGDYNRICYAVFGRAPRRIGTADITTDYVRGIARQALGLSQLPPLRTLRKADLKRVIRSLAIHKKRHANPA